MGWIISIVMIIVLMVSGKEVNPDAYIIAAALFAVAGSIANAARTSQGRDANKKEQ